jgi:hypothetical protein
VIGASDLAATAAFFRALGFEADPPRVLAAPAALALYGLEQATPRMEMRMPGADCGGLSLVATPHPPAAPGPYDHGPHVIDLYTTDMARSLESARRAGARCFEPQSYRVGPLEVAEGKAVGPDGAGVIFLWLSRRRPSLLDREPARLHSEVHAFVQIVESIDRCLAFFHDRVGLAVMMDQTLRDPAVTALMQVPRLCPVRIAILADEDTRPVRLELIEFPEDEGAPWPPGPLRAGLHAPVFEVGSIEAFRRDHPDVEMGETAFLADGQRAAAAVAPGGVAFELREGR